MAGWRDGCGGDEGLFVDDNESAAALFLLLTVNAPPPTHTNCSQPGRDVTQDCVCVCVWAV